MIKTAVTLLLVVVFLGQQGTLRRTVAFTKTLQQVESNRFSQGAGVVAQKQDAVEQFEHLASLIREDRIKEAEAQLTRILNAKPNHPVALNLMGTIRAKQGRVNEAEGLFLRAIRSDNQFAGAHMNLAYIYLLQRAPEKAIGQFKDVIGLEPDNSEATEKLADLLLSQKQLDECIRLIEQQRKSRSISPTLLVTLGDAYLAKGAQ
ncbi:MAG TPA: tetratricopeptide repeat protein [Pyrinomonadaceae bacterium]|nr:tetratricopeptide repeat protein [Pyrinomonadaceae bacterium]